MEPRSWPNPRGKAVQNTVDPCLKEAKNVGNAMTFQDKIVRDPAICNGQPVIRGTRVLVRTILGYLAQGEPTERILEDFPSLTADDVRIVAGSLA